jgi:prepilin-type processing-associated H-X9-DG protein
VADGITPRTSGKAIASLVLGICSFLCLIFTGIPAIILGVLGLGDIKKGGGAIGGKGIAVTGIVLGSFFSSFGLLFVIGVLVGLLIPAVNAAREAGRRVQCGNNLRQIGLAMVNYASNHNVFPPAGTVSPDGKPLLSWRVLMLPYLDQVDLYEKFKLDEPWDSPNNKPLLAEMPDVYRCPNGPLKVTNTTVYQVLTGPGTLFEQGTLIAPSAVTDGLSNTLMVVESREPIPWTQPHDREFSPHTPIQGIGSGHPDGFNAGFADGAVRFLPNTIEPGTLEALATRNGREAVDPSRF